jgi:cytochrome b subunit of formate dehydrogenase
MFVLLSLPVEHALTPLLLLLTGLALAHSISSQPPALMQLLVGYAVFVMWEVVLLVSMPMLIAAQNVLMIGLR